MKKLTIESKLAIVVPGYESEAIDVFGVAEEFKIEEYMLGPHGGGLIFLPSTTPKSEVIELIDSLWPACVIQGLPGTEIGNPSGLLVRKSIELLAPPRIPRQIVQKRYKPAKVRITFENDDELGSHFVLVLPTGRSQLKLAQFAEICGEFGLQLDSTGISELQPRILKRNWYSETELSRAEGFQLTSNQNGLLFTMAAIAYAAQFVDIHLERLYAVHLIGAIESKPSFKEYWTS